jgi:two-component system CheB/CheR fusion protein
MPSDSHIAFVVVQHLDPKHESMMASLLAQYTDMSVQAAEDGIAIEPGHIYVKPPGKDIGIVGGKLRLVDSARTRGARLPEEGRPKMILHAFRDATD